MFLEVPIARGKPVTSEKTIIQICHVPMWSGVSMNVVALMASYGVTKVDQTSICRRVLAGGMLLVLGLVF
jgi:hypothetical protein